ncbi:hypothetical protein HPB50_013433 [Hyalomma asiaticum]|uniref:Uncharacterized protein n=1 Tax=Hyalomma asiaticum TaxID=266040 RepID=A0ACB7TK05_HYAAI|nr:hypothetical protein HPB50_013433 [Hyalomma asiaticum]
MRRPRSMALRRRHQTGVAVSRSSGLPAIEVHTAAVLERTAHWDDPPPVATWQSSRVHESTGDARTAKELLESSREVRKNGTGGRLGALSTAESCGGGEQGLGRCTGSRCGGRVSTDLGSGAALGKKARKEKGFGARRNQHQADGEA